MAEIWLISRAMQQVSVAQRNERNDNNSTDTSICCLHHFVFDEYVVFIPQGVYVIASHHLVGLLFLFVQDCSDPPFQTPPNAEGLVVSGVLEWGAISSINEIAKNYLYK